MIDVFNKPHNIMTKTGVYSVLARLKREGAAPFHFF